MSKKKQNILISILLLFICIWGVSRRELNERNLDNYGVNEKGVVLRYSRVLNPTVSYLLVYRYIHKGQVFESSESLMLPCVNCEDGSCIGDTLDVIVNSDKPEISKINKVLFCK